HDVAHLGVGVPPLGLEPTPTGDGQLRQRRADLLDPLAARRHRHQVGLGEVAVVLGVRLHAARRRRAVVLVEVARLLDDRQARVEHTRLAGDLVPDGALDRPERVHVLRLGARAERGVGAGAQRQVDVGAHVAALHAGLGDTEGAEDVAQRLHVRARHLGRTLAGALDRPRHDLDQRDARTVVVDERVLRAVDAARGTADVRVLARVLLHVRALDLDAEHRTVLELDVDPPVVGDRLVVLRGLEVLRDVRVEVVLPGEPAALRDGAVQRQADADRVLHGLAVDDGQGAREPEAHRGHLRVRLAAELDLGRAEHLGPRAELHVHLDAQHRVVAADGVLVADEAGRGGGGHRASSVVLRSGAWDRRGPPQRDSRAASSAAPTRYIRSSALAGARIWKPTGRPSSDRPFGTDMPGTPARLAGMVAMSLRYIASGSSSFSPNLNAVVGAVGETSTSAFANAAAKSRWISVRTFCALP